MSELYLFSTMQGIKYPFNPNLFTKTLEGITYPPTVCSRSSIQLHENLMKSEVTFSFPVTNSFARSCVDNFIEDQLIVEVFKDSKLFWKGRVVKAELKGMLVTLSCDSGYNAVFRKMAGAKFSPYCWKTLYSTACGVDASAFSTPYAVYTLDGTEITLTTGKPDNYFAGGIAIIGNQIRGILTSSATGIRISDGFILPASGTLTLRKGCSLTRTSCLGFSNLDNFGGFPYIPATNPTSSTGLL